MQQNNMKQKLARYRKATALIGAYVLLVLCFLWYVYIPVPDGFSAPWRLRGHAAKVKLKRTFTKWSKSLGLSQRKPNATTKYIEGLLRVAPANFDGVDVKVYKPDNSKYQTNGYPTLVYYHGGGWINFNADSYQMLLEHVALDTQMLIISVNYRLAPAHKFPAPFDDCYEVTKYVFSNYKSLGVDPSRVALGGDSAGGNLAAAVALKLRDEHHEPQPIQQILIYPPLQAMDFSLPSYVQNSGGPLLTARTMALMWSDYAMGTDTYTDIMVQNRHTTIDVKTKLYHTHITHENVPLKYRYKPYQRPSMDQGDAKIWSELRDVLSNPYFAPLMTDDLSNLPTTLLYTAHYDVLRDDGLLYAKRLTDAGVTVTHVHGPTGIHGVFNAFHDYEEADSCLHTVMTYLKDHV